MRTDKVTTILVLIIVVFIPLLPVINSFLFAASWLKDIICLVICFLSLSNKRIRINPLNVSVFIYTVLVIFGLLLANNKLSTSVDLFRYRCEYAITFSLAFSSFVFDIHYLNTQLIRVITILGTVVAVVGLIELFFPDIVHRILYPSGMTIHNSLLLSTGRTSRLISTLSNPINLGLFMTICCAFSIHNLSTNHNVIFRLFNIALIVLYIIVTLYTYSRTAYAGMLSVIFTLVLGLVLTSNQKHKLGLISMLFITLILGYYLIYSDNSLISRFDTFNWDSFTDNTRFERAAWGFQKYKTLNFLKYIFGFGPGTIVGSSNEYVFEFGYASLLFESGIMGLFIFIGVVARSARLFLLHYNSYMLLYISIMAGFLVVMLSEDVYAQYPFSMFFWLSACMIQSLDNSGSYEIN